jgi:lipopolysaccharide transport system permease protein
VGVAQARTDVFTAVLPWQLCSTALIEASGSLIGNASLLSKVYFPRLIIPGAAVMTSVVDFVVTLVLLMVLMWWYQVPLSPTVVFLPLFVVLSLALSLGVGLLFAALNVNYRDFRYVVPFIVQMGLFVSPIAFASHDLPEQWRLWYWLNPMCGIIQGFRWSFLGDRVEFDPTAVAISAVITGVLLVIGIVYFRRMERGFADAI